MTRKALARRIAELLFNDDPHGLLHPERHLPAQKLSVLYLSRLRAPLISRPTQGRRSQIGRSAGSKRIIITGC